jgi:Transposase, Mutator family
VPARLSPVDRVRAQIEELFASEQPLAEILEQVARLSIRLVLQSAVEAEVSVFLGRDRYQRDPDARPGYRNGHQPVTVKTTAGPVTLERPKLRGTEVAFASRLLGKHVTRTNALEALVIAGYVRGLSTRDVEAALAEALGPEAALSKSTVSRICEAIKDEFDTWRTRSLAEVELEYLYLDASHFRMHPGARAEPVLCAWGITTDGKPVLLALDGANAESTDACLGFLRDLVARDLRPPLLVITDGAPGLLGAVEQVFPDSLRQRCLVHRAATPSPRSARPTRTPSRPTPGRSSTRSTLSRVRRRWPRRAAAPRRSLPGGASAIRVRSLRAGHPARADHAPALPTRALDQDPPLQPDRADLRRDQAADQGDRPAARRTKLPIAGVGGAGPRLAGLAWRGPATRQRAAAGAAAPSATRPSPARAPGR